MFLEDLRLVAKVAELRSITAAANALDIRPATASAAVKRMEEELGAELFIRTTRQLRLSPAGERYLPYCQQVLATLEEGKQSLKTDQCKIEGDIRISVPSDLGRNLVTDWLDQFLEHNEQISLKVHVSDTAVDFYRDPIDMALRYGEPKESGLYGFKISSVPRLLCASPDYIGRYGQPRTIEELTQHRGVFFQLNGQLYDHWKLTDRSGKERVIQMRGSRACNDSELVRRWCLSGKGIATKSFLDIRDDLIEGRLINLLPDFCADKTELWLVCPTRQSITPAMRRLRDRFREQCEAVRDELVHKGLVSSAFFDPL